MRSISLKARLRTAGGGCLEVEVVPTWHPLRLAPHFECDSFADRHPGTTIHLYDVFLPRCLYLYLEPAEPGVLPLEILVYHV